MTWNELQSTSLLHQPQQFASLILFACAGVVASFDVSEFGMGLIGRIRESLRDNPEKQRRRALRRKERDEKIRRNREVNQGGKGRGTDSRGSISGEWD